MTPVVLGGRCGLTPLGLSAQVGSRNSARNRQSGEEEEEEEEEIAQPLVQWRSARQRRGRALPQSDCEERPRTPQEHSTAMQRCTKMPHRCPTPDTTLILTHNPLSCIAHTVPTYTFPSQHRLPPCLLLPPSLPPHRSGGTWRKESVAAGSPSSSSLISVTWPISLSENWRRPPGIDVFWCFFFVIASVSSVWVYGEGFRVWGVGCRV